MTLEQTQDAIQCFAADIERMFRAGAKVTILIRNPGHGINGSADMLVTNDSWEGIRTGIAQREAQEMIEDKRDA